MRSLLVLSLIGFAVVAPRCAQAHVYHTNCAGERGQPNQDIVISVTYDDKSRTMITDDMSNVKTYKISRVTHLSKDKTVFSGRIGSDKGFDLILQDKDSVSKEEIEQTLTFYTEEQGSEGQSNERANRIPLL